MQATKCVPLLRNATHKAPISFNGSVYRLNHNQTSNPNPSNSNESSSSKTLVESRASAKLFADAALEEELAVIERENPNRQQQRVLSSLQNQHANWNGEESIQDAVLRMLVDKYKPLRGSSIITAEEKLKKSPPKVGSPNPTSGSGVASTSTSTFMAPRSGSWKDEPLLPSNPDHKPWDTKFKVPSHEETTVKVARLPSSPSSLSHGTSENNERLLKKEKEKLRRVQQVGRLSHALESTLDYKLGLGVKQELSNREQVFGVRMGDPASMRGWNSLIEDKIQKARNAGVFNNVKGRGQPLVRSIEETNPFIAREEFLMNRIVQRNGAVPPWVEVQNELDTAVTTFREMLKQSWMRRALRILTNEYPVEHLHKIILDEVKALRDTEWIKKEESYHETAVTKLNSLVRKYNGMAPYAIRRPYYVREVEVKRMYEGAVNDIMRELEERIKDPTFMGNTRTSNINTGSRGHGGSLGSRAGCSTAVEGGSVDHGPPLPTWRFRDLIRPLLDVFSSRQRH